MLVVVVIVVVAFVLRSYAANRLYVDYDEPTYLNAAMQYANAIFDGKYKYLAGLTMNYEHPVFYKIVYGVALLTQPESQILTKQDFDSGSTFQVAEGRPWAIVDRYVSVIFGTATVAVLAILNPFAGLALAVDTLAVKYTSVIYLEALPALTSLLTALAYLYWFKKEQTQPSKKNLIWLGVAAIMLGATIASKYTYSIVGIAVGIHFSLMVLTKKLKPGKLFLLVGWAICSLVAFFVCDPYLWVHTLTRLMQSLSFHLTYTISADEVLRYHYPFYQTLVWLTAPFTSYTPAASSAIIVRLDVLILILAIIGLPLLYKKHLLFFIWLLVGILALFFWPTKWPQYTMIILTQYCFSAGLGLTWIVELIIKRLPFGKRLMKS